MEDQKAGECLCYNIKRKWVTYGYNRVNMQDFSDIQGWLIALEV